MAQSGNMMDKGRDAGFDEDEWFDYQEEMYHRADKASSEKAIAILRDLYLDPRSSSEWTDVGREIADDKECLAWMANYWYYLRWNEHGNEASLSEVRFTGLIDSIIDPQYVLEYLGHGIESGDDFPKVLSDQLIRLNRKYTGSVSKAAKPHSRFFGIIRRRMVG